jgi:hypothetical protein
MEKETLKNIFVFLKNKEYKNLPKKYLNSLSDSELIKIFETHPDDSQFVCDRSVHLNHKYIIKLPNDLYVDGYLDLSNSNIKQFPNKLHVSSNLYLFDCKQITELPNKLYVGVSLELGGCEKITKLPDDLYVGGYLAFNYTNITELPTNLRVGGDMFIIGTPLADKYTDEEIYKIVASTGGEIIGEINRQWK